MKALSELVKSIIDWHMKGETQITLLSVCPNSDAVLEAAVKSAANSRTPMLFAATLNQVDGDGGYTGWTQAQFVTQMQAYAAKYHWSGPLYPCLDHGGPWLKDRHTLEGLSYKSTMEEVKKSITACLEAGYRLLHIDPTVDRSLMQGQTIPLQTVVDRTIELIAHAESERKRLGLAPIDYEVGTEEVHGGLVDLSRFKAFLENLRTGLDARGLASTWPCFIVAQVGTDLHTTSFDTSAAGRLYDIVTPLGSLVKGHYTDWVENPADYPATGIGGANVGPEFTAEEYLALRDLDAKEQALCHNRPALVRSGFITVLQQAVVESGRWMKWLHPNEDGLEFDQLTLKRREWLVQTSARYIWTNIDVIKARKQLYANLSLVMPDPHAYVIDRIMQAMDKYINAFHLLDSLERFE